MKDQLLEFMDFIEDRYYHDGMGVWIDKDTSLTEVDEKIVDYYLDWKAWKDRNLGETSRILSNRIIL